MADRHSIKPQALGPAGVFRKAFCLVPDEKPPLVIDLRAAKHFKKEHVGQSFNCIVSKNGKARKLLTFVPLCTDLLQYTASPW